MTARRVTAVAAAVAATAAVVAATPLLRDPVDEAHLRPKGAAPALRFSVDGWTVLVPEQLEIFYDYALYNPDTLTLSVQGGDGSSANCTDSITPYIEYAAVPWKVCAAPVFAGASGRYSLTAQIEQRASGTRDTYTAGTRRLLAWRWPRWPAGVWGGC